MDTPQPGASSARPAAPAVRRGWSITGVVQGVGFRPTAYRVAADLGLTGRIANTSAGVRIELQGPPAAVARFRGNLEAQLPPLARIITVREEPLPTVAGEQELSIAASTQNSGAHSLIPVDVAPCPECVAELRNPGDRRYGHPFITCTNCGPRLSIITQVPYDRAQTTMADFPLCPACRQEYTDPTNRRYHAQPIACFECGPTLWWESAPPSCAGLTPLPGAHAPAPDHAPAPAPDRAHSARHALAAAKKALDAGQIVAVKGVGGFHLMVDARNQQAVARLRERKRRPAKPLALMVPTLQAARELLRLSPAAEAALTSPARPIVTAPAATGASIIAPAVAPGLSTLGVMLPSSPLHHLLVEYPVVATSGNISGEPVCYTNEAARAALGSIADGFVLHNRPIHIPVEDSVLVHERPVRRSRGYAPLPLPLPVRPGPGAGVVLAAGGEMKNTLALTDITDAGGVLVHLSAHVGEMGSLAAQAAWHTARRQLESIRGRTPQLVVCDAHPNYATSALAERQAADLGVPVQAVYHHHAHALALLAEHGVGPGAARGGAVVATLDGTGFGVDGSVWGGEVVHLGPGLLDFRRVDHLPVFGLVGGDRAVRFPWRCAVGVAQGWGVDLRGVELGPAAERDVVLRQLRRGVGVARCSSLGRLFDAVAALLGAGEQTYQAQAAIELEDLALRCGEADCRRRPAGSWAEAVQAVINGVVAGQPGELVARGFHRDAAWLVVAMLDRAAAAAGTEVVGVTGGCADNGLLLRYMRDFWERTGRAPLLEHESLPAGDGALAVGQAYAGVLAQGARGL